MNALPILSKIMTAMNEVKLEVILVGNAAAALRGAPVTTDDFDFLFRPTKSNLLKLFALAKRLEAGITHPKEPVSSHYRISNDELAIDMMEKMSAMKSFESLRSRSTQLDVGRTRIFVASLEDVIKSKRAAGRPKDKAVLPILEKTLRSQHALSEK